MLEHLFGSKTRLKLLRLFFGHPGQKFYVRELSRIIGTQLNSVRRELLHLLELKIIIPEVSEEKEERRKYYNLNPHGTINSELQSLLVKAQIWGEKQLVEAIKKMGAVDYLILTGRFTGVKGSPTDLLVVGNVSRGELNRFIRLFEKEFGSEVRYTVMTLKEFLYRRDVADKFLSDLLEKPHVVAVDKIPPFFKVVK